MKARVRGLESTTVVGTAQKLLAAPGLLRASRLPHLHANRSRRAPIDMNGAGTEESTKILKHKPEQPSILGHHPGCQQFLKSNMKSLGN